MAQQLGNRVNASIPATGAAPDAVVPEQEVLSGDVTVEAPAPTRKLNAEVLLNLGAKYKSLFDRYASERIPAEQKWLKNLRQYLGIYDPEIERQLPPNRSRAYPRLTRMKCIAMLSRLMNLMFPGNEDNWELTASPSPSMSPEDVANAVSELIAELQAQGVQTALTQELVDEAVRALANKNAKELSMLIKDQLTELGGGQTVDWITLNRKVIDSGVRYGIGVLEGPYVRKVEDSGWMLLADGGFQPVTRQIYKPVYEHLSVWDFYPDMSARKLPGDGYFIRKVMGASKLRKLADRPDFFGTQIKQVIALHRNGNYRAKSFENELKVMGTAMQADNQSTAASGREKYEVIVWKGPVSAHMLREAGADVPDEMMADDIDAEIWMVENHVIKAEVNAWRKMGEMVPTAHVFNFDEDDSSPVGQGLPGIVRDSQLSVCAATRMVLDNASVTCGPNLELNTSLMRADQDINSVEPYKIWYRDDEGLTAQFPAVRELNINGHIKELQELVRMFLEFAEMETFIGPATGGDFQKMPSEPMRTASGASMLRGDAALPFKDIVRNYDSFTQSVLWSLVMFNRKFNPDLTPSGDYAVIARGATSLIAKEVRGAQIDMLSQTLTPEERDHIDERRFVEAKFASRDMEGMLVSPDEAKRRKDGRAQAATEAQQLQTEMMQAEIKKVLSDAFKNVAQGQKNTANADATAVKAATDIISAGEQGGDDQGTANRAGKAAA